MVNLELYRIFISIYREGTISKAAISVDITQPAASQQIAALEKTLKTKLFERTPRRMVPTNNGHELYTKISDSFDWIAQVSQDFILTDNKQTLFTIGVPLEFYEQELIRKIRNLPFRCNFIFGTTIELARKFEDAQIDAMIATHKINISGVTHEKIFTEEFWLIAPKELDIPSSYSRSWLIKQRWIAYDAKLSIIRKYFKMTYNIKPAISPSLISPNLHAILKSIESGVGMSVLPDYICKEAISECKVKLVHKPTEPITNELYFVYKSIKQDTILVKGFRNLFLK